MAYRWCLLHLKPSKFQDEYPKFIIRNQKSKYYKGHYNEIKNIIYFYLGNHRSQIDICETILHEWKHYQQNIVGMYDCYFLEYGKNSKNHPYEITAETFAKKKAPICKNWIKENIKQEIKNKL